ncbi:sensor histidine kinase [Bacillus sp. Marseille-P3661]|uniref:sensor histidine kinase n=1 Tax=Bacillus sp. Marseille-P3661 TaxID=1936234 RepID=UPI000C85D0C9|nr:PAS domain S-box protein [Bacillus sp. Marseille-P3661]
MNYDQQFYETILNHTSDMLLIVDQNRHIIYATPSVYEITGYSPEELKDVDVFIIVHPEDRKFMEHRHKQLMDSGKNNSIEYRMVQKSGEIRYFECRTTPLPSTEHYLQVVSARDITERKRMELDLEYHKNRHEVLQNSLKNFSNDLTAVMKLTDLEDRMMKELVTILPYSNPRILTSIPRGEINLCDGKMIRVSNSIFIKLGDRKQCPYILSLEANAVCESMELTWLETLVHYSAMVFESLNMIENLMEQLSTASTRKETPQWVLRMMFNLQEQQRMTLSSDLHDTVLQDQIDLYRRLESLLKQYEIEKEAKSKLIKIEQGLLDIIHEIRVTCNHLRPPFLRELGLETSLENLFEYVQLTSTYRIHFTSEDLSRLLLSEEQMIGMYRIVQEFLHHAEEYAKASVVEFDLFEEHEVLKLVYHDDGVWFDNGVGSSDSTNIRLASVNQRAQSLGGKITLTPIEGNGLLAELELPIHLERSVI